MVFHYLFLKLIGKLSGTRISEGRFIIGFGNSACAEVDVQSAKMFGPDGVFAKQACADLIDRQRMAGTVDDYLPGYKREICNPPLGVEVPQME